MAIYKWKFSLLGLELKLASVIFKAFLKHSITLASFLYTISFIPKFYYLSWWVEEVSAVQNGQALVKLLEQLAAVRSSVSSQAIVVFFSHAGNGVESRGDDSNEGDLV